MTSSLMAREIAEIPAAARRLRTALPEASRQVVADSPERGVAEQRPFGRKAGEAAR